jgi:hypothetical protein
MAHHVASFFNGIFKAIPVLLVKAGTVLLLIFTIGMFSGYFIATLGLSPLIFLIPVVAMIIMWYKLDEGVFFLILLTILILFFPEVLNGIFSMVIG